MCLDPVTAAASLQAVTTSLSAAWGTIGTAATLGGGLISAYSTDQNGRAQAAAAQQQAQAQDAAAKQAIEEGERETQLQRRRSGALMGENRAALAANGVDVNSQLGVEMADETRALAEEDAFAIRENAARGASSLGQQAANSRAEAASAKSQGTWGAFGTVLGTTGRVADRWANRAAQARYGKAS